MHITAHFWGKCWESFCLWCYDKRPARTSRGLFKHAENLPSEWKPRVLSEYILMHFQPPTRVHKAIKPATDKHTCRKVIKCKVLWRTAELQGLLQGHALIYWLAADEPERQAVTGLRAWERLQPLAESSHFTSEIFGKRESGRKFCQSCKSLERYNIWRCQRRRTGFGARDAFHVWVLN